MAINLKIFMINLLLVIFFAVNLMAGDHTDAKQPKYVSVGNVDRMGLTPFPDDAETQKLLRQNQLENEGSQLIKKGLYREAIEKFRQSDEPSLRVSGYQPAIAKGMIREVYWIQGMYEQALAELMPLRKTNPKQESYIDEEKELEAIISARDMQIAKPIYDYIDLLKKKYQRDLPPQNYWFASTKYTDSIIRLFNYVGDSDRGIAFVDQILGYKKLRPKARSEYLKIREAFEQDKKEGFKGCLDAQPGTVCMGRATEALIQSDYFPW